MAETTAVLGGLDKGAEYFGKLKKWGLRAYERTPGKNVAKGAIKMATYPARPLIKATMAHPMGIMVGAGIAYGAIKGNPFKGSHPFSFAEQMMLGDPHAAGHVMEQQANYALENQLVTPVIRRQINYIQNNYNQSNGGYGYYGAGIIASEAMSNSLMIADQFSPAGYGPLSSASAQFQDPSGGPNGNIVFGLYNNRLNG